LEIFKEFFESPNIIKIFQNAVFDMKMLKCHGGYYPNNIYDTMLVEQLLNLGKTKRGASLSDLVKKYLGLIMNKEPRGTFQDYNQVFKPYQLEYAASDVEVLSLIRDLQLPAVVENKFENVCRLEFEFTRPMCEMELNGITLDVDKWRIMMKDIKHDAIKAANKVQSMLAGSYGQNVMFGMPVINLESNQQLLNALKKYGLTIESTDAKVLKKYQDVPVIKALLEYRKLAKLVSTYGESLLERINPVTGRLHTRFQQMVSTGRMSSSAPNLQNIPKKQKYRSCFISKPGYKLITADMSGAELRILGNLSEDPVFMECFTKGIDLHSRSASEVFKVAIEEVDKPMRNSCKALSFGLCVDENTELITEKGICRIKDVDIGDYVSHDLSNDKIIDKKYMGKKETYTIISQFGYEMTLTEDHIVKVINLEGNYVDKKVSELDIHKDQLCIKAGSDLFSEKLYTFEDFDVPHRTNYKPFELPKVLDKRWASFLGLFVAEGSLMKVKGRNAYSLISFGFSLTASSEFIAYIKDLLSGLFGNRLSTTTTKTHCLFNINSVLIAEWLFSLFDYTVDLKTETVSIPTCIKQSPKNIQSTFLSWLMEGDGTVKSNGNGFKIQYSSKSIKLIKDVQLLLLNFGIISSITEEVRKKYPGESYYVLSVLASSNKTMIEEIPFITCYKNDKCISSVKYSAKSYSLKNQAKRLLKVIKNIPKSLQSDRMYYDTLYNCIHYNNNSVSNIYLDRLSCFDDFFKFISSNCIIPLDIKSIKKSGVKRVYDISVKNRKLFLANGFIVHNCYGMSKYGLADRLDINEKKAETLINDYFGVFSSVKKYLDQSARLGVKNGYTTTVSGRRRFYSLPPFGHPDRKKIQRIVERAAKNAGIQGANADTIKESMIYLVDRLEESGYDAKLILTVHDEVVVEVREDQIEQVAPIVQGCLKDGFGRYFHKISMESDALVGPCWLKDSCEEKDENGDTCDCCTMTFVPDDKLGTKLACSKCGALQE
jgi:DNA polymerase I-like protein with 3'-5' exonuclease and polymerase domains